MVLNDHFKIKTTKNMCSEERKRKEIVESLATMAVNVLEITRMAIAMAMAIAAQKQ